MTPISSGFLKPGKLYRLKSSYNRPDIYGVSFQTKCGRVGVLSTRDFFMFVKQEEIDSSKILHILHGETIGFFKDFGYFFEEVQYNS